MTGKATQHHTLFSFMVFTRQYFVLHSGRCLKALVLVVRVIYVLLLASKCTRVMNMTVLVAAAVVVVVMMMLKNSHF